MLITDQGFRDAVTRAVAQAQRARDERDTCPFELEGCGRKGVLCAVTRRGMTLCRFCPACGWNTFGVREKQAAERAAWKAVKRGPRGKAVEAAVVKAAAKVVKAAARVAKIEANRKAQRASPRSGAKSEAGVSRGRRK